jgi:ribulose-5-phosphate 4-epimerase/fuculose-1-phosphate aldolase
LVKIDTAGKVLHPSAYPVNPAGFTVHAAIHNAMPNAHCVMHTHTTTGSAVACTASGLAQNNFYSAQLHNQVAYHDFEGITIHADEAPRLLQAIGDKPLVILRNHGLLAWGATLPMTFARLWTLQRACDVQCMQAPLGPAIAVSDAVAARASRDTLQFDARFGAGQDVFDAIRRLLDAQSKGYEV